MMIDIEDNTKQKTKNPDEGLVLQAIKPRRKIDSGKDPTQFP